MTHFEGFANPPREFSLMPFWFWNDRLTEDEILRQIADFEAHGVYGFVIHPRVGLPRDTGWMSDKLLHFMRLAVEEAQRRGMYVILYDEGMYPSGSSSGQVVAHNPAYQCRCLARVELDGDVMPDLAPGHNLVAVVKRANGQHIAVIDRPVDAYIRGLHYIGAGPQEDEPPAADLLNPDAVKTFLHLVYDGYAEALGEHFGKTILAIFTDEPGLLGRCRERDVRPGTTGILEHINAHLGYDFTPHLPSLWYDDEPEAGQHRAAYKRAISARLEATYYRQLYEWCDAHHIALTGHPARGDEIGFLRYFHIPGQDLVWRWVLPNEPSALEGPESTQGKCSASAMVHLGRRRNSNECFGAYGPQFTWEEMKWLVDWCFVRGVNLLYPHAFFYSMRGPRKDERPPDVGPNSPWWDEYQPFADYCRRLSWLNTDSHHVCHHAILCDSVDLPWSAAKVCFQHQRDFNYLEVRHLWEDAEVTPEGITLAGMMYQTLIIDNETMPMTIPERAKPALQTLSQAGKVIIWGQIHPGQADLAHWGAVAVHTPDALRGALDTHAPPDLNTATHVPNLRYRHVIKDNVHYYLLNNEGTTPLRTTLTVAAQGEKTWLDPFTMAENRAVRPLNLTLPPYTTHILRVPIPRTAPGSIT